MTDAQQRALERLEAADGPLMLNPTVGRNLVRLGYAEAVYGGWVATRAGRAEIARQRRSVWEREAYGRLTVEQRQVYEQGQAWLDAHFPKRSTDPVRLWALQRHELLAQVLGEEPLPFPEFHGSWVEACRERARVALACLESFARACDRAARGQGTVVVAYEVEGADPVSKRSRKRVAKQAAAREDGAVDLSVYRAKR